MYIASVKVMRSHDYCHFEVALGSSEPMDLDEVDKMRKEAARLADKAVEQYKIAKANAITIHNSKESRRWESARIREILEKAETDRTPAEQARLKANKDKEWAEERGYDYEDDWRDDEN